MNAPVASSVVRLEGLVCNTGLSEGLDKRNFIVGEFQPLCCPSYDLLYLQRGRVRVGCSVRTTWGVFVPGARWLLFVFVVAFIIRVSGLRGTLPKR